MRSIEDELSRAKFMRIHKFCIAAIDHITAVGKTSVFVGEAELPVGDIYKEAVDILTRRKR